MLKMVKFCDKKRLIFLFLVIFKFSDLFSWGFFAHKKINRFAVFALPKEMFGFYKKNIDYVTQKAVNADKRRHIFPDEPPKHYIDLDYYEQVIPIDTLPHKWVAAVEKYSADTLKLYGILPWQIKLMMQRLEKAFISMNKFRILKHSADIGHYVADAHVPLHTTMNYNGQFTGQKGIHAFWESRLPELFAQGYNHVVFSAKYIKNVDVFIWNIISESFGEKDEVLLIEKKLSSKTPSKDKYTIENKNNRIKKIYSKAYSTHYHNLLDGMVEERYSKAISNVANIWYTCWVNAGMPVLENLKVNKESYPDKQISKRDLKIKRSNHE